MRRSDLGVNKQNAKMEVVISTVDYWRMHKGSESLAEKKIPLLVNSTTKTVYKSE